MTKSIATGAKLTKETFDDFIERLKFYNLGDSKNRAFTSEPVFQVREKRMEWGFDGDYDPEGSAYRLYDRNYLTGKELIEEIAESHDLSDEQKKWLDDLDESKLLEAVQKYEPDCELIYYNIIEKVINTHLTREAAAAFIKRKQHDYQELFIYVDSAYWCWEFSEIMQALLDGRLTYQEPKVNWFKKTYQYLSALIS